MLFCKNCDSPAFSIFEHKTIFCIKCCSIYNLKENEKGELYLEDTGLIK